LALGILSWPVALAPDGEVKLLGVVAKAVLLQILSKLSSRSELPALRTWKGQMTKATLGSTLVCTFIIRMTRGPFLTSPLGANFDPQE
jgi:hypothetical protein